jgi:hypothetical protein
VAAGVALCAAAAVAVLAAVVLARSDRLVRLAGRRLGREITAGRTGFSLRGGPGIALHDVRIAEDPAFPADPFVSAPRVDMRFGLRELLRRRLVVDRVVLHEPVVNLIRDPTGRLNVQSLGRARRHTPAPASPPGVRPRRQAFQLTVLRLRHGAVRYIDRQTGRRLEFSDVAVDARQPRFDAEIPVTMHGRLSGGDVRLQGLVSDGVLDPAGPSYHGAVRAGAGSIGPLVFSRVDIEMTWTPPASTASFALAGGYVAGLKLGGAVLEPLRPFLRRPGDAERLAERYPDVFAAEGVRFTRLGGSARSAGKRIELTDLAVDAPSYAARGSGSLVADGDIDLPITLSGSQALTEDVLGRAAERSVLIDERGRLTVPLALRGPTRHPHVRVAPAFTEAIARQFLDGSNLREAATLLERLLKKRPRER